MNFWHAVEDACFTFKVHKVSTVFFVSAVSCPFRQDLYFCIISLCVFLLVLYSTRYSVVIFLFVTDRMTCP